MMVSVGYKKFSSKIQRWLRNTYLGWDFCLWAS